MPCAKFISLVLSNRGLRDSDSLENNGKIHGKEKYIIARSTYAHGAAQPVIVGW
jgi:hypothetical protein